MKTTGSWQKGQSGNPGGKRKQDYRIKDLAQKKCPRALQRLIELSEQSDDLRTAFYATMGILAYGIGKPTQPIDLSAKDGSLAEMFRNAVRTANRMTTEAQEAAGLAQPTH